MHLIIAEKNIAGQRIAQVLGGKTLQSGSKGMARYYSFERKGESCTVLPLSGHIVEVDFPKKYNYWKGTDLNVLVDAPIEYNPSNPSIAGLLREYGKKAKNVIIATDADREGESIGVEALRLVQEANPNVTIQRAHFSAMTPKELEKSFDSLVKVDFNLSDSADSRREIDLIWGAVLTRFVSIMSNRMGKEFISVGRVQTPVLALIVNREKERRNFVAETYWEITAHCDKELKKFTAGHKLGKIFDAEKSAGIFSKVKDAKKGIVTKTQSKKRVIARPPPFDTTTLLRAASALGFTAGQAMNTAESLYMAGYISYPRTDNQTYPAALDLKELLNELRVQKEYVGFVDQILGKPLHPSQGKKNTTDHPPVHPVKVPSRSSIGEREWKMFDLVARRFLATFLPEALTQNVLVELDINTEPFTANGQTILDAGWKAAYPFSQLEEVILPPLVEGDHVNVNKVDLSKKETQPPARYSQSGLLKIMEQLGLGTKSTRHEIIQKLFARKYISGLKSIEPNEIAFAVIDSLEKYCSIVTEPKMTADVEKEMDEVADGKKTKSAVVNHSKSLLHHVLDKLLEHKIAISVELRKALIHQDVLGTCPADGGNLIMRKAAASGKRFLGCANFPNCRTTFSLPQKGSLFSTGKTCGVCNKAPLLKLSGKRFKMEICVNMDCPSKDEWKKKQAEGANNPMVSSSSKPFSPAVKNTLPVAKKRKTLPKPSSAGTPSSSLKKISAPRWRKVG